MVKKNVKNISSSVLDMKFMRKTKHQLEVKDQKKRENELKRQFIDVEGTSQPSEPSATQEEPQFEFVKDLSKLEGLAFGRMSFKGFNPEVEKLMVYYERLQRGEESDSEDSETEIGDNEMADSLRGASSTIGKLFKGGKQQQGTCDGGLDERSKSITIENIRKRTSEAPWAAEGAVTEKRFRKPRD